MRKSVSSPPPPPPPPPVAPTGSRSASRLSAACGELAECGATPAPRARTRCEGGQGGQNEVLHLLHLLHTAILPVLWSPNRLQGLACRNRVPDQLLDQEAGFRKPCVTFASVVNVNGSSE